MHNSQVAPCVVHYENVCAEASRLKDTTDVLQMRLKPFYWHQRELQCSRAQGPASMYDHKLMTLRSLWISPTCVDMKIVPSSRQGGSDRLFDLYEASFNIPTYHARMKTIHAIKKCGQVYGYEVSNRYVLKVPHPRFIPVLHKHALEVPDTRRETQP